jgi:gamma-glutamyltranspeptidase/glutathione hydrolase
MIPYHAMRCRFVVAMVAVTVGFGSAHAQERSADQPPLAMPAATKHGMVVAQEKIAAKVGAEIMARGGNAVDAAVATGFAMIHSADKGEDITIDYRETAPGAATRDMFLGNDGQPDIAKSRDSALGIGVPGTVAGLALALEKYGSGRFSLSEILHPARSRDSRW